MWTRLFLTAVLFVATFVAASATRPATLPAPAAGSGVYPPDAELDRTLKQLQPRLRMKGASLEEAVDRLREQTGVNLFVDWPALEAAKISRKSAVDVDLHDVPFARALDYITKSVATEDARAGWGVDDGVVVVTTADAAAGLTQVKVYDVRDLVTRAGPMDAAAGTATQPGGKTRDEPLQRLMNILTGDVATDTWKDNGGPIGSIQELNGRLVIQQTWENHRRIDELLTNLRANGPPDKPRVASTTRARGATP